MTGPEAEPERMDAPNQQAVREDVSGPADEGTGGPAGPGAEDSAAIASAPDPDPEPEEEEEE